MGKIISIITIEIIPTTNQQIIMSSVATGESSSSPSADRRRALKKEAEAAATVSVLPSCPLSKYLDVADRLFEHFQEAMGCPDNSRLDESYVLGLRFAGLVVSTLPQHPEWKLEADAKRTKRLTSQVKDVLCVMNVIKDRMDAEELQKVGMEAIARQKEEARRKEEEREAEESRRQQQKEEWTREQLQRATLEEERAQFNAELRSQWKKEVKNNFWGFRLRSPVYRTENAN